MGGYRRDGDRLARDRRLGYPVVCGRRARKPKEAITKTRIYRDTMIESIIMIFLGCAALFGAISAIGWLGRAVKNDPPVTDGDGNFV